LRDRFEISNSCKIVGNVSYMYPPKRYLGQTTGIKGHELIIDALGIVAKQRKDVVGVLIGGQWGGGTAYEARLRKRAWDAARRQIRFTGRLSPAEVCAIWRDLDVVVHVPVSENCGGAVEPLANNLPIITSNTGGLPELVIDGVTGWVVSEREAPMLARCIGEVLKEPEEARRRAAAGRKLARLMFDVERTAGEVLEIYKHIIGQRTDRPPEYDSMKHVAHLPRHP
jgi:glycosyltransferase involved in cell wall biosynthesis